MSNVTGMAKLFELLGHEVIPPLKPTRRTIDLGVKYSPEFMCFPFKVVFGTYMESIQRGAEVLITSGGDGPCRAGLYGQLSQKLLRSMGKDVELIIFDSLFQDFGDFLRKILRIKNKTPLFSLPYKLLVSWKIIRMLDWFEKRLKVMRAYEVNRGDFNRAWEKLNDLCGGVYTLKDARAARREMLKMYNAIPVKVPPEQDRIRIGIVGEIFVVMESTTNIEIEQTLNDLGCEVENGHYISDWVIHSLAPKKFKLDIGSKMCEKARRFVKMNCGGHDQENIGRMVDFAERGFDGIIHLMPFSCLPELITQSLIPNISKSLHIPILSLSLDEQMGQAHNKTRIEAFIDLARANKGNISTSFPPGKNRLADGPPSESHTPARETVPSPSAFLRLPVKRPG
jgi:predicted nucleotide-binding protein (sugar kinase/HSP70/actin superfamily)